MCGIYGIFSPGQVLGESDYSWAQEAGRRLRHRGPDGHVCLERSAKHCLLGHERLAIIDLECGTQPLSNEDQSVWVICNGEIYNYIELRQRLIAKGHRFASQSDCEVLVHLYEDKGTELLDDLEGMFAFAILDERKGTIFLARDRFGEKPLYWTALKGRSGVAFASEMKALFSLSGVDREFDVAAIAQFLTLGYIPAPRTHLHGVRKLMAGEAMVVGEKSGGKTWRYYVPELPPEGNSSRISRDDAVERVREHLLQSLRIRLRSDVPVAAFLSGGIDSTFVVTALKEIAPSTKFSTFCASFESELLDEAPFAREVAEQAGTDHHEVRFSTPEILSSFDALIDHFDEPFGDYSMFPTFAVCREARKMCTVVLSGDGGDECFGGYTNLFRHYSRHGIRRFPGVNLAGRAALKVWKKSWRGIGPLTFLSHSDEDLLRAPYPYGKVPSYFLPEARTEALQGISELETAARRHARLAFPRSAIESATMSYLPEQIMVKVDRASMRSALECRTPFLDRTLVEFVRTLPDEYHFERGLGKALLRRALPDWVSDRIRWRGKRGFTPPLADWLRGDLREQMKSTLEDFPPELERILSPAPAFALYTSHQSGENHADQLFRWLVLSRRCRA
ncbi:MAG TPA: asparagine synthase (glutamine-hydrolyzing), partial [Terriglobales bacterium]|nr:asparagine synthase (glutamine-hydrolyzing) [Terriglobales bacterium]